MARIKNKQKYPEDLNVTLDDYLVGTDVDESGKTKSYPVREIVKLLEDTQTKTIEGNTGEIEIEETDTTIKVSISPDYTEGFIPLSGTLPRKYITGRLEANRYLDNKGANDFAQMKDVQRVDSDIKPRLINLPYYEAPTFEYLAAQINAKPYFEVLSKQLPIFYAYDARENPTDPRPSYKIMLSDLGTGTYGVGGGVVVEATNIIMLGGTEVFIDEIEQLENTQLIDFGTLGGLDIWNYLNFVNPERILQNQSEGYRVFKADNKRWLFTGSGGTYGLGTGLISTEDDFSIESGGIGDIYITKESQSRNVNYLSGEVVDLVVGQFKHVELWGTITKVTNIKASYLNKYDGRELTITNRQTTPIEIVGGANLTLVGNVSTILEPTESIRVRYGTSTDSFLEVGRIPKSGGTIVGDATTTEKGIVRLSGDLGGTAENPTVPALANIYTKQETKDLLTGVYTPKGSVSNYSALISLTNQEVGWVRNVLDTGKNFVYLGASAEFPDGWDDLGGVVDISGKEDKNKKGVANGYAPLDNTGKVPAINLPAVVPIDNSGKEDKTNKKTDVEASKSSNIFYLGAKAVYDFVVLRTVRKIESLMASPVQITKKWNGTQSEFKSVLATGLDANTEYAYVKLLNIIRNPTLNETFLLDEFDNETIQIIETNCKLQIPTAVVDFSCRILVLQGVTFTLLGGASITSIIGAGSTGNQTLTKGLYTLIQKGTNSTFILC